MYFSAPSLRLFWQWNWFSYFVLTENDMTNYFLDVTQGNYENANVDLKKKMYDDPWDSGSPRKGTVELKKVFCFGTLSAACSKILGILLIFSSGFLMFMVLII